MLAMRNNFIWFDSFRSGTTAVLATLVPREKANKINYMQRLLSRVDGLKGNILLRSNTARGGLSFQLTDS
jgi:hypothetical protein